MTWIALHRAAHTSLATDQPWLEGDDWTTCEAARELLQRLERLAETRETELAQALAAARAEGLAQGRREGREQALRNETQALWHAWQTAAAAAQADTQSLRDALVRLSLQVVQHITDQLAPADVLAALARRACEQLLPPRAAVLRVHPDLAEGVRQRLQHDGAGAALEVRGDARLGLHDCEFDTPAGQLLAGVQAQLGRVGAAMQGAAQP